MKPLRLLLILSALCLLSSCHSHRQVARGSASTRPIAESGSAGSSVRPKQPEHFPSTSCSASQQALLKEAFSWIGVPYKYGGHSKDSTDCSGFVMEVFLRALDVAIPRTTADQSNACQQIPIESLDVGDLIFFHNTKKGTAGHVGMYVGDGRFIHASSSKGVIVSCLDEKYYIDHYLHSGRLRGVRLKEH